MQQPKVRTTDNFGGKLFPVISDRCPACNWNERFLKYEDEINIKDHFTYE